MGMQMECREFLTIIHSVIAIKPGQKCPSCHVKVVSTV